MIRPCLRGMVCRSIKFLNWCEQHSLYRLNICYGNSDRIEIRLPHFVFAEEDTGFKNSLPTRLCNCLRTLVVMILQFRYIIDSCKYRARQDESRAFCSRRTNYFSSIFINLSYMWVPLTVWGWTCFQTEVQSMEPHWEYNHSSGLGKNFFCDDETFLDWFWEIEC